MQVWCRLTKFLGMKLNVFVFSVFAHDRPLSTMSSRQPMTSSKAESTIDPRVLRIAVVFFPHTADGPAGLSSNGRVLDRHPAVPTTCASTPALVPASQQYPLSSWALCIPWVSAIATQ